MIPINTTFRISINYLLEVKYLFTFVFFIHLCAIFVIKIDCIWLIRLNIFTMEICHVTL